MSFNGIVPKLANQGVGASQQSPVRTEVSLDELNFDTAELFSEDYLKTYLF